MDVDTPETGDGQESGGQYLAVGDYQSDIRLQGSDCLQKLVRLHTVGDQGFDPPLQ
jgi:hypothetical protein